MKAGLLALLLLLGCAVSARAQTTLRVGDSIEIRLGGVDATEMQTFSALYTIDDSGELNMPYIGTVKATGLTTSQLQKLVEDKLVEGKIYTHPTITVSMQQGVRFVNVGGAVKGPGRVPYTADLTVMSVISAAGGFNDYADQKHVRWVHEGKTTNLNAKLLRKDPSKDPKVFPGDQIEVSQSLF